MIRTLLLYEERHEHLHCQVIQEAFLLIFVPLNAFFSFSSYGIYLLLSFHTFCISKHLQPSKHFDFNMKWLILLISLVTQSLAETGLFVKEKENTGDSFLHPLMSSSSPGGMNSSDATDAGPIPASTSVQVNAITINPRHCGRYITEIG